MDGIAAHTHTHTHTHTHARTHARTHAQNSTSLSLAGKFGSPYLGEAQQPQEQRYPFLSVCAVFSCLQTMVWLPVFEIFNMRLHLGAVRTPYYENMHWKLTLEEEEKNAGPGTGTRVSIAPGFSVGRSTN